MYLHWQMLYKSPFTYFFFIYRLSLQIAAQNVFKFKHCNTRFKNCIYFKQFLYIERYNRDHNIKSKHKQLASQCGF